MSHTVSQKAGDSESEAQKALAGGSDNDSVGGVRYVSNPPTSLSTSPHNNKDAPSSPVGEGAPAAAVVPHREGALVAPDETQEQLIINRNRQTLWSEEEKRTLANLCQEHSYHGRISWEAVLKGWTAVFPESTRTKRALTNAWQKRDSGNVAPASPLNESLPRRQQRQPAREAGEARISPGRVVPIPQSAARPTEALRLEMEDIELMTPTRPGPPGREAPAAPTPVVEPRPTETGQRTQLTGEREAEARPAPGEIPEDFKRYFLNTYRWAVQVNSRRPVRRLKSVTKEIIGWCDQMIAERLPSQDNLESIRTLNALVYAAAKATYTWVTRAKEEQAKDQLTRTEANDAELRSLSQRMGLIKAILRQKAEGYDYTPKMCAYLRKLRRRYRWKDGCSPNQLNVQYESLQQRFKLLKSRVVLRSEGLKRRQLREKFEQEPSLKHLAPAGTRPEGLPEPDVVVEYWKSVVGIARESNLADPALNRWRSQAQYQTIPEDEGFGLERIQKAWDLVIKKTKPWKAAGPDGVQAYWWRRIPSAREALKKWCSQALTEGDQQQYVPAWVCQGRTVLIFKKGDAMNPANYRPIACLNTCYKMLTGLIAAGLRDHCEKYDIFPVEQRALARGEWGCIHAHLVDQTVTCDAAERGKPLSVCWVDYRKAFDSVPHVYLLWLLRQIRAPALLVSLLEACMHHWATIFEVAGPKRTVRTDPLEYRNGVFQGDSMSPLLYCLAIAPISFRLQEMKAEGYRVSAGGKERTSPLIITHQFYMDDLKCYAGDPRALGHLYKAMTQVSEAIGLSVNPEKCAQGHKPARGCPKVQEHLITGLVDIGETEGTYRYLGLEQSLASESAQCFEELKGKMEAGQRLIWSSDLTAGQKIRAYNTCVVPILRYQLSCGVRPGRQFASTASHMEKLDIQVRGYLSKAEARYRLRSSATSRLYLPRKAGGSGLISLEQQFLETTLSCYAYLMLHPSMREWERALTQLGKDGSRTVLGDASKVIRGHQLDFETATTIEVAGRHPLLIDGRLVSRPVTAARLIHSQLRERLNMARLSELRGLKVAGRVFRDEKLDPVASWLWIRAGRVKAVVERNAMAVQENSLITNSHPMNTGQKRRCRRCQAPEETGEHIVSCCKTWIQTLYVTRHDSVARNVYYVLAEKYGLKTTHWSIPLTAVDITDRVKVLWNHPIKTDAVLCHNRPDIVVFDKKRLRITIIEVAVAFYTRLEAQERTKRIRYMINGTLKDDYLEKDPPPGPNLVFEMRKQYGWEVVFVPIVIGTCGEVLKNLGPIVSDGLELDQKATSDLIERMCRSAVLGSHRVLKVHLAVGGGGLPAP